ncbi:MAG: MBOAT family protein [Rhodocyclales bacterium]|nr:MBOAT family protein [Rhodocyclales bacterium]
MLFNSFEFLFLFLPLVFLGFFRIAQTSHRLAALWLASASVFFYGFWNPKFVSLLLASVVFNYAMGYAIGHAAKRKSRPKALLVFALTANLVVLGIFKYSNFFISTVNSLAGGSIPLIDIILPLGISFFTFTQIAFLVDVYRGIAREYSFIHYLLFVTYFPHLIAGPVLHHKQMMPQFGAASTYCINPRHVAIGIALFSIGLAKKVLLADNCSEYSTRVFAAASRGDTLQFFEAWAGALSYTLQLYFDFSGYSDMAVGLSKMFGVDLPLNFNSPYKAKNIIEFWRRWHMTLSQFLRDYLYIPLGGNRKGPLLRHANLMVTMLLGGLWHGANWTFVIWGGLHGIFLIVNHGWQSVTKRCRGGQNRRPSFPGSFVATGLTFIVVVFAWVFFRSENLASALLLVKGMVLWNGVSVPDTLAARISEFSPLMVHSEGFFPVTRLSGSLLFPLTLFGLWAVFLLPNSQELLLNPERTRRLNLLTPVIESTGNITWEIGFKAGIFVALLLACSLLSFSAGSEFLYFQF